MDVSKLNIFCINCTAAYIKVSSYHWRQTKKLETVRICQNCLRPAQIQCLESPGCCFGPLVEKIQRMILKWHSSHLILNTSLCSRLNCFPSGFLLFVPPLPLKLNPWSYSWSRDSYYLFFVFPWDFSASKTYLYLKREMSEPKDIPSSPSHHHASFTDGSPLMSSLLPNPIITKRTRTLSM